MLNDYARALFTEPNFTTSTETREIRLTQVSLPAIGLPGGGRFDQIMTHAARMNLHPCPLETGSTFG